MDPSKLPANQLAKLCCDAGNMDAWAEFQRRFQRIIQLSIYRAGCLSPETIEDLEQDVALRLVADRCRILRNFQPIKEDSIFGFLATIAQNATRDYLRGTNAQKVPNPRNRLEMEDGDLSFIVSPASQTNSAEWHVLMDQIDRSLKSLMPEPITPRDYNIFWMFFRAGLTANEICRIPAIGLTIKGVEASIHRTKERLKEKIGNNTTPKRLSRQFSD
jgi:RNA polymerase sigma-70 factor (ECF subfamily)